MGVGVVVVLMLVKKKRRCTDAAPLLLLECRAYFVWTFSCHECACLRALLTLVMFSTPVVLSQSSKAFAPCLA